MRFLVTGGNGFIGSCLVDELAAHGHQVTVCDVRERRFDSLPAGVRHLRGDYSRKDTLGDALAAVDVVYHLAWTSVHESSNRDPAGDAGANLVPTLGFLEDCRDAGVKRFIFLSSGGTVYGNPRTFPTPESHPQDPISAYGVAKLATEKYLHLSRVLHGFDYLVFRPSVPYGPRQDPGGRQGAVAVFLHRVARGLPITIWGDGSVCRDFFFVSDLVDVLVKGAGAPLHEARIFNIGGGTPISLNELLRRVEDTVHRKASVNYLPPRKFDPEKIWLDTRLATRELGWHAQVSLEQGLAQTWDWMQGPGNLPGPSE